MGCKTAVILCFLTFWIVSRSSLVVPENVIEIPFYDKTVCSSKDFQDDLRSKILHKLTETVCVDNVRCQIYFCICGPSKCRNRVYFEIQKISDKSLTYADIRNSIKYAIEEVILPYMRLPCGRGRVTINKTCGECPVGTYTFYGRCKPCGPGTFSDVPGMFRCTPCPVGSWTLANRSVSKHSCKQICTPRAQITSEDHITIIGENKIVAGSTFTVSCTYNWAFDKHGTKTKPVKCIEDKELKLPSCQVRWCADKCPSGYQCDSCQCLNSKLAVRCNGVAQCSDGSDEKFCPRTITTPSSIQFNGGMKNNNISVPGSLLKLNEMSVCVWGRLFLSPDFSSLISVESDQIHHVWLKATKNSLYVQINHIFEEIPLPYDISRKWFSLCVSISTMKGEMLLYLDGKQLLQKKQMDISSVQGQKIIGRLVLGGLKHATHPPYNLHGLLKDMTIWNSSLTPDQVAEYTSGCLVPRTEDIVIQWDNITQHVSKSLHFIKQNYTQTCAEPACTTSCPPDAWQCGSCDCIPLRYRCNRIPGECLDDSDERGCSLTDSRLKLTTELIKGNEAEMKCLERGATLAVLSSADMIDYAARLLQYNDYDKAFALKSSAGEVKHTLITKLGRWVTLDEDSDDEHAYICEFNHVVIYRYHNETLNYEDASKSCKSENGELATVVNQPQYSLLLDVFNSQQCLTCTGITPVWLGGSFRHGQNNWDNGDMFPDFERPVEYVSGDKITIDADGKWERRDEYEDHPFLCMIYEPYNHTTSLVFEDDSSLVKIHNPLKDHMNVFEVSTCASFRTAAANGTILSYATKSNDNELMIMVTNKALEIMVHNVPFFVNKDLTDGYWHTVCFTYSKSTLMIFIDGDDHSIHRFIETSITTPFRDLVLGAEQDFQESKTALDKYQFFKGDIANLNIWRVVLNTEELRYLSETQQVCQPILTRDDMIILRWGDILGFAPSSVKIGSMGDNNVCRAVNLKEPIKLEMGSVPLTIDENNVFRLCRPETENCKSPDLRFLARNTSLLNSTIVGNHIKIVNSSDVAQSLRCTETVCELVVNEGWNERDGMVFILKSTTKSDGQALESHDTFYITDISADLMRCTTEKCYVEVNPDADTIADSLFSTILEKRGWSGWSVSEECKGECGDSHMTLSRSCTAPEHLVPMFCPGQDSKVVECYITSCATTDKCIEGAWDDKYRGTLRWGDVRYVHYSTEVLCPAGAFHHRESPMSFKIKCTSEGYDLSDMKDKIGDCAFLSESAQRLFNLMEIPLTGENVEKITGEMMQIVSSADDIGSLHIDLVSSLTNRALESGNVTHMVQDNIISTIDSVVDKCRLPEMWKSEDNVQGLLLSIDKSADLVELGDTPGLSTVKRSVVLVVTKTDLEDSLHVTLEIPNSTNLYSSSFSVTHDDSDMQAHAGGIGVYVPNSLSQTAPNAIDRVWFTVYNSDKLFLTNNTVPDMDITTNVVGIGIGNNDDIRYLEDDVKIQFTPKLGHTFNPTAQCVFWDTELSEWSSVGMTTDFKPDTNKVLCRANHLTNFAVLMNVGNLTMTEEHYTILQTITLVGGCVSIVCLLLTVIGLSKFRIFRSTPTNQIHISLSFTLMMGLVFLMIGLDRTENMMVCTIFAMLIHYFYLSAISWMLIEGINLYIAFVKVFPSGQEDFFLKCSAYGFGFPAAVVFISTIVNFTSPYRVYASSQFCWLNYIPGLVAFVGPVILTLLTNIVIFGFVIKQIFWRKQVCTQSKMGSFKQLRAILCLMALMGLTWIVGAFTIEGVSGLIFQYLFAICNISQGIFIFYFHCASKPDVRNAWINSLSSDSSRLSSSRRSFKFMMKHKSPKERRITITHYAMANATCSVLGLHVPLLRDTESEYEPTNGFDPWAQLVNEDSYADFKHSNGSHSMHSTSHAVHNRYRPLGDVVPASLPVTVSTQASRNTNGSLNKYSKFPNSPVTGDDGKREHIYQTMKHEDECESPMFPPSITPPPPPSTDSHSIQDTSEMMTTPDLLTPDPPISPDLVTPDPPVSPDLVTPNYLPVLSPDLSHKSEISEVLPENSDIQKEISTDNSKRQLVIPEIIRTPDGDLEDDNSPTSSSEEQEHDLELGNISHDEEYNSYGSDEDFATPDIYNSAGESDRPNDESRSKVSWKPTDGKQVKKKDVQIERVKSFGTVKDTFEHEEDNLNPNRTKRSHSILSHQNMCYFISKSHPRRFSHQ